MIEISIIIPIYNVEKYLEKCLESIYKLNLSNKEIILINDRSPDNSYKIIEKYKKKYPRETVVINHNTNKGLSEARNTGIKNSQGKYLLFIDSDDFVDSIALEKFLKKGIEYKNDIFIGHFFNVYNSNITKERFSKQMELFEERSGLFFLEEGMKRKCFYISVWKNLYRKDFLVNNQLFFEKGILHEDNLFTPIAFCLAKSVRYSQEYFYFYRQTNNLSITKTKNQKRYIDLLFIAEKLLEFSKINNLDNKYFNRILVGIYLSIVKDGNIKEDKIFNQIRKLKLNIREKLKLILILFLRRKAIKYK